MSPRYLIAVTRPDAHLAESLAIMADVSGLEPLVFGTAHEALVWLDVHEPHAVVVDLRLTGVNDVCRKVRGRRELGQVPVIALTPELGDDEAARLFASGVDEVLPLAAHSQLLVRLQTLARGSLKPPPHQGIAIIADAEPLRCDIYGRLFSNAGFDIKYAVDDRAVVFYDKECHAEVILLSPRLADPLETIREARAGGSRALWVVIASRANLAALSGRLKHFDGVAVIARDAPPTDALFFANELRQAPGVKQRRQERKLYGTQVRFKPVGAAEDDYGFSYNVSEGGLYVRTLAVPRSDRVWLQVRPPMTERWVSLEAEVAWRREPGSHVTAAVPPGFGAKLSGGLGDSLEVWRRAVSRFVRVAPKHSPSLATLVRQTLNDEGLVLTGLVEPFGESVPLWGAEDEEPDTLDSLVSATPVAPPRAARQVVAVPAFGRPPPLPSLRSPKNPGVAGAATPSEKSGAEPLGPAPAAVRFLVADEVGSIPPQEVDSIPPDKAAFEAAAELASTAPESAELLSILPDEDLEPESKSASVLDLPASKGRRGPPLVGVLAAAALALALVTVGVWQWSALSASAALAAGDVAPKAGSAGLPVPLPPKKPADQAHGADERGSSSESDKDSAEPRSTQHGETPAVDRGTLAEPPSQPPQAEPAAVGDDNSDLLPGQGALRVNAERGLRVFVQGVERGTTGERLPVSCGYRHVRLRAPSHDTWRSEGQPVLVACGATTDVEIAVQAEPQGAQGR